MASISPIFPVRLLLLGIIFITLDAFVKKSDISVIDENHMVVLFCVVLAFISNSRDQT